MTSRPTTPGAAAPVRADFPHGVKLLHDPVRNKGTGFTEAERDALGLRGLLPPRPLGQEAQAMRVVENLQRKPNDLEKYIFLVALQDRNETLFYRVLVDHLEEMMPLIYTPTVGQACQLYGHILRRPRGLYISLEDRGRIREVLANWPHDDVRVVVVTDGERILGLGDLGTFGMGIPIGKLSLYTACAGIHPTAGLPVTLDVGTNNASLLADPLYTGLGRRRERGEAYDEFVDEFIEAVTERYPRVLVQLEDFANANAFKLLRKYRDRLCLFDDDIQGTGSVALAGLHSAMRMTGGRLADQRILFLGAGEAGVGIGEVIAAELVDGGLDEQEARSRCWYFDSKGLVVRGRADLAAHKRPFAHDCGSQSDFMAAIEQIRPTAVVGVCGVKGTFTRPILERLAEINDRPIVFALSNPTSRSECTAEEAYEWTGGRAIFASGSPFAPVEREGRRIVPGQANNVYVFPGVGLGVVVSEARVVTSEMFSVAARALAREVTDADLAEGRLFPPLARIRDVSVRIATAVAEVAYARGLARAPRPDDLASAVRAAMFEPVYRSYV
jgi:malate dehydrogenase (oxaloacetate-decarboxylating)(NADP+)